jgi:hypothetical protein
MTSQLVWDRCETWYQWMVARLLYTNPSVRAYDLSIHAQQAVDRYLLAAVVGKSDKKQHFIVER